ncbi:AI-2E family transporter [Micrococcus lylae]|uniref:AI-2E family transporter n=1 Tax=Micrococcus lylae TaxID=1273 RepID=A0ABY2K1V4_9MICC|nr:AI-2E family transporter [Micrococcus lylae]TFI01153.1 AI-2E family transporter [Micrococcus lylae]
MTTPASTARRVDRDVPYGLTVAAAWSWRVIVILFMAGVLIWLLSHVSLLVIPVIVAGLLATLLSPVYRWMVGMRTPPILASLLCVLLLIVVVLGLLFLSGQQLAVGFADMSEQVGQGIEAGRRWLESTGIPMPWQEGNGGSSVQDILNTVRENSSTIMGGAITFGSTAANLLAGTVMALFTLIFFLYDGGRIWAFMLRFVPAARRNAIDNAGHSGWRALGSYVRVQIFVAFVDAVGIGLGAWLLGVPLAFPLAVLVFLASFIPMVGAVLTGALAVLLALITNGMWNAVFMLLVVLLVQQLESNVLQPLVMGKAVSLHPLAVFLAVAGGSTVLGLVGAVFAVPLLAFVNAFVRGLQGDGPHVGVDDEALTLEPGDEARRPDPDGQDRSVRREEALVASHGIAAEEAAVDAGIDPSERRRDREDAGEPGAGQDAERGDDSAGSRRAEDGDRA